MMKYRLVIPLFDHFPTEKIETLQHINNAYRKLDVSSRSTAIARLRELMMKPASIKM